MIRIGKDGRKMRHVQGEEKFVVGLVGKPEGKIPCRILTTGWQDNIKVVVKAVDWVT